MNGIDQSETFALGDRTVKRLGYGAMQLAGPGVFGPPRDHDAALAVLREAVARGVNHIDTSDFYGPHVTNRLIREALAPYSDDLVIVTKIGALRGADGSWLPAFSPEELTQAVHDNLRNLGLDVLDVVNLRVMFDPHGPAEGSIEAPLTALAELQRQGLVRHIGLSNVTRAQIAEGRRIAGIVCVQNQYNLAHRGDDALIDDLVHDGVAYVPFFPLGGFNPLQSSILSDVAPAPRRHAYASRARLAASPRAEHPADPRHLLCRASAGKPRRGRIRSAERYARCTGRHCGERRRLKGVLKLWAIPQRRGVAGGPQSGAKLTARWCLALPAFHPPSGPLTLSWA
jgi:aryl-alcohol dehydrogenase-like predicted oxidoreductase